MGIEFPRKPLELELYSRRGYIFFAKDLLRAQAGRGKSSHGLLAICWIKLDEDHSQYRNSTKTGGRFLMDRRPVEIGFLEVRRFENRNPVTDPRDGRNDLS
jgi:hypothetical protein